MHTEKFPYHHGETECIGFLAYEEKKPGPLPGVIVAHAWRGQDEFARKQTIELAKLGFVALTLDIYGGAKHTSDPSEASKLMAPFFLDRKFLQERTKAGLEALKKHERVDPNKLGAIGYCFGGLVVYELFRSGVDVKGVVSFHAIFSIEREGQKAKVIPLSPNIKGSMLILHGHDDPFVSEEDLRRVQDEFTKAKVDWQLHTYGHTMHQFTNPEANTPQKGTQYNKASAHRSWQSMQNFFQEVFH